MAETLTLFSLSAFSLESGIPHSVILSRHPSLSFSLYLIVAVPFSLLNRRTQYLDSPPQIWEGRLLDSPLSPSQIWKRTNQTIPDEEHSKSQEITRPMRSGQGKKNDNPRPEQIQAKPKLDQTRGFEFVDEQRAWTVPMNIVDEQCRWTVRVNSILWTVPYAIVLSPQRSSSAQRFLLQWWTVWFFLILREIQL